MSLKMIQMCFLFTFLAVIVHCTDWFHCCNNGTCGTDFEVFAGDIWYKESYSQLCYSRMDCSGNSTVFDSRRMRILERGYNQYNLLKFDPTFDRNCTVILEAQLSLLNFEGYKWWERKHSMDFGEFLTDGEYTWCEDGPTGKVKNHGVKTINPCGVEENWPVYEEVPHQ